MKPTITDRFGTVWTWHAEWQSYFTTRFGSSRVYTNEKNARSGDASAFWVQRQGRGGAA